MNLLNLEYFLVAAEELNFTKAANRLYITQQSLYNHIIKLEDYFGCKLFDRGTPMSLTPAGEGLERSARKLLGMALDMEKEIQDIKDFRNSEITIGITRTREAIYLPPILSRFNRKYPNIRITIFEGSAVEIEEALHQAQIDLSIGSVPLDNYNVQSDPFWEEHTVIVVPEEILKRYFPEREKMIISGEEKADLKLFANCPFIALNQNSQAGMDFYLACQRLDIKPRIVLQAKSLNALVPLCIEGLGVLVCPEIFLWPYRDVLSIGNEKRILVFPAGEVATTRDVCVNYLKNKYLSTASKEFIRLVLEEADALSWKINILPQMLRKLGEE